MLMHKTSHFSHNHVGLVILMNNIIICHFKSYQHYLNILAIDEGLHLYPEIFGQNRTSSQPLFVGKKKQSQNIYMDY